MEQRTDEWYEARLGIPTASSFSKLITASGKPSSQAQTYINQLIAEKVTGKRPETYTSEAMSRGIELEGEALQWYEILTDNRVETTGFWRHPNVDAGCSPDGLIRDDGLVEFKAPLQSTHIKYLRAGNKVPSEYWAQVQGQLWVMDRVWCDFVSYHPELPPLCVRTTRDEGYIKLLEEQVFLATEQVKAEAAKIAKLMEKTND